MPRHGCHRLRFQFRNRQRQRQCRSRGEARLCLPEYRDSDSIRGGTSVRSSSHGHNRRRGRLIQNAAIGGRNRAGRHRLAIGIAAGSGQAQTGRVKHQIIAYSGGLAAHGKRTRRRSRSSRARIKLRPEGAWIATDWTATASSTFSSLNTNPPVRRSRVRVRELSSSK